MKVVGRLLTIFLVTGAIVLVLLFTPLGTRPLEVVFPVVDAPVTDITTLELSQKTNQYLACPPDFCRARADTESPVFDLPVEELSARWQAMVDKQPRVTERHGLGELQFVYVQRSALFRFPDLVAVQLVPLSASRSTLAIYSRSIYGLNDLGVNRARVETWLENLRAEAP